MLKWKRVEAGVYRSGAGHVIRGSGKSWSLELRGDTLARASSKKDLKELAEGLGAKASVSVEPQVVIAEKPSAAAAVDLRGLPGESLLLEVYSLRLAICALVDAVNILAANRR